MSPIAEVRDRPARERGESDDKQEGSVFHGESSRLLWLRVSGYSISLSLRSMLVIVR